MPKLTANKVEEYKFYDNMHYVYVKWSDDSKCWIKLSNLKNKDLLLNFFSEAISILRLEQKAEENRLEKEREELLLNQIYRNNLEESAKAESDNLQKVSQLVSEIKVKQSPEKLNTSYRPKIKAKEPHPLASSNLFLSKTGPVNSEHMQNKRRKISYETFSHAQNDSLLRNNIIHSQNCIPISSKKIENHSSNSLTFIIKEEMQIKLHFYLTEGMFPIAINPCDISFLPLESIYPFLHSQFLIESSGIVLVPSIDSTENKLSPIEMFMKEESLCIMGKSDFCYWIAFYNDTEKRFFNKIFDNSKYLIVRIDFCTYINRLFEQSSKPTLQSQFFKGVFKYGSNFLLDTAFNDHVLSCYKNIFVLANPKSAMGSKLFNLAQFSSNLVNDINSADLVLVQESFLDFIHVVLGTSFLKNKKSMVLLQQGFEFKEILPQGGLITFSKDFIESGELLAIADLVEHIQRKNNWSIKVEPDVYAALKQRLQNCSFVKDYPNKMKLVYRMFKENLVYIECTNFLDYLEKHFYLAHRQFFRVSLVKESDSIISIEEALAEISQ